MIRYFPALACISAALALGGCWQTNEYQQAQYVQSNCPSPSKSRCATLRREAQYIQSNCISRHTCWYANEYPAAQYSQRTQTIAMGAGNAQEVNAATQVIDPWNRRAYNSRIPGNGDRTVNAVKQYRTPGGTAAGGAAPGTAGAAGGGGAGGAGGTGGAGLGGAGGVGGTGGAGTGGGGITGTPPL